MNFEGSQDLKAAKIHKKGEFSTGDAAKSAAPGGPRRVSRKELYEASQGVKAARGPKKGDLSGKSKAPSPPHPSVAPEPPPEGDDDDEFPAEPKRPMPRYEPDADGVIVIRRPPVRFTEEE